MTYSERELPSGIRLERFNPVDNQTALQLGELYAQVFAGPPWNEYTICSGCNAFFGLETQAGQLCPCGACILSLAYPKEQQAMYLQEDASRKGAKATILRDGDETVGFSIGFPYTSPREFVSEKYREADMQEGITSLLQEYSIQEFFYISEVGVAASKRGQRLSNVLVKSLVDTAGWQGLPLVMRTNWQSPMVAVAQRFDMTQIMGPEVMLNQENRSLVKTGSLVNGFGDSELPDRVLFIRKALGQ